MKQQMLDNLYIEFIYNRYKESYDMNSTRTFKSNACKKCRLLGITCNIFEENEDELKKEVIIEYLRKEANKNSMFWYQLKKSCYF